MPDSDFIHIEVAGESPGLLLLHGTGGDEQQLLPLAAAIAPGHAALGIRGQVSENGAPRFFRRFSMFDYDVEDITRRVGDLADWLEATGRTGPGGLVALGYSNGANFGASLLLLRPEVIAGAILLRANLPLEPRVRPQLAGRRVLILNGASDPYARPGDGERLDEVLSGGGAEVTFVQQPTGHELSQDDVDSARDWFRAISDWPVEKADRNRG